MTQSSERQTSTPVDELFVKRWSPRAFDAQYELSDDQLETLLGAARWAPSSYNEQPWEFKVALRGSKEFSEFLDLLVDANQVWAKRASALFFIIGRKHFKESGQLNPVYQFDCGSAWMSIATQATMIDLYTHGMAGIKRSEAEAYFGVNGDKYEVICAFAAGKQGDVSDLPEDLQKAEKLRGREDINEISKIYH